GYDHGDAHKGGYSVIPPLATYLASEAEGSPDAGPRDVGPRDARSLHARIFVAPHAKKQRLLGKRAFLRPLPQRDSCHSLLLARRRACRSALCRGIARADFERLMRGTVLARQAWRRTPLCSRRPAGALTSSGTCAGRAPRPDRMTTGRSIPHRTCS